MTKLLDRAIAEVRELPDEEQDRAAESLLVFTELAKKKNFPAIAGGACGDQRIEGANTLRGVRDRRASGGRVRSLPEMKVRYSRRAIGDLVEIANYIRERRAS